MSQVVCEQCGAPTWVESFGCTHCGAKDTSDPPTPIAAHPVTAKCAWEVTAGMLPGRPDDEFTKRWFLSSEDPMERFQEMHAEARLYADSIVDPRVLNWVRIDWVWF